MAFELAQMAKFEADMRFLLKLKRENWEKKLDGKLTHRFFPNSEEIYGSFSCDMAFPL